MKRDYVKKNLNKSNFLDKYLNLITKSDEYIQYIDEVNKLKEDLEYLDLVKKCVKGNPDYHQIKLKIIAKEKEMRKYQKILNDSIHQIECRLKEII